MPSSEGSSTAGTRNNSEGNIDGRLVQGRDIDALHTGSGHVFTGTVIYQELLSHRFGERLHETEAAVRELVERERELRTRLDAEVARAEELEKQLRTRNG